MIDKITILGGSSVYIPEFIVSALTHNLPVEKIVLFGKPGRKLELVSAFCQRLVNKNGYATQIECETDLVRAIEGASYIVNHVRVGGMKARMRDEMSPPQFEMMGSDSIGAGAIANALRTLPVVFEFAQCIEENNPDAVFINLTNPVGVIVEALSRYSSVTPLGISDLPAVYAHKIAAMLGREERELQINYIGLHDLGWIQDVRINGISRMSQVLEHLEREEDEAFDHGLINLFRMIPTRATGLYFHRHEVLKKQQSCSRFRSEILFDAEKRILKLYNDPALNVIPDLTRQRNALWYALTLVPLLQGLERAKPTEMVLCVQNQGAITDLPDHCSVEVPVSINRKGCKTHKVGMFPRFLKGIFCAIKESERLVIEAVRHKSYEYALQSMAVNPFVSSVDKAKEYLSRVIRLENLELH